MSVAPTASVATVCPSTANERLKPEASARPRFSTLTVTVSSARELPVTGLFTSPMARSTGFSTVSTSTEHR